MALLQSDCITMVVFSSYCSDFMNLKKLVRFSLDEIESYGVLSFLSFLKYIIVKTI